MTTTHSTVPVGSRPEDERLPIGPTFAYGIQHILTMYGGVIAAPLIIGQAAGLKGDQIGVLIAAALLVSGLATILQSVGVPFFGSQLPLVQGISFASVSTLVTIATGSGGIRSVFGAVIVSSLVGLAISPFFSQVIRLFPPVVNGTIITVIGLSLLPVAVGWIAGNNPAAKDYAEPSNIALAAFTLVVILLLSRLIQGPVSRLSILIGMVAGTLGAAAVGKTDFSNVGDGSIFALPQPFAFGAPTFNVAAIVSMIIVVLVIMTETTADIIAVGEIVGTDVTPRRVGDGLRADMLSSAVAPVFNTFPASAFAQNVGVVAITGIKSRFVVTAGGAVLVVLGLLPVLGRVVADIPTPVLGGAGIVLFGSVAASGIRTLAKVDYDGNLNIVLVATAISFGVIPIAAHGFYDNFPTWVGTILDSGISAASLVAVLLNILFNEMGGGMKPSPSVVSAAPAPTLDEEDARALRHGEPTNVTGRNSRAHSSTHDVETSEESQRKD